MSVLNLPEELLQLVAEHLPLPDLVQWMTINKKYFRLFSADGVWKGHYPSNLTFNITPGTYWKHFPFVFTFRELFEVDAKMQSLIAQIEQRDIEKDIIMSEFKCEIGFIAKHQPIPIVRTQQGVYISADIRIIASSFRFCFGHQPIVVHECLPLNSVSSFQTLFSLSSATLRITHLASWSELVRYLDKIQEEGYISIANNILFPEEVIACYRSYFRERW